MHKAWASAVIIFVALLPTVIQMRTFAWTGYAAGDFGAFYCAARVASHGADPYHTEPLRTCEASSPLHRFSEKHPGIAVPAPFPGYVIALLVPFSVLPFTAAAIVWTLLLFVASASCVLTIVRFAGVSWQMVLAALSLSLGVSSISLGQIVPFALAAICASALFASTGRWRAASVAAAVAMIEPHLGLPVCITLAVWAPATRVTLGLSFIVLATLSLAMLGVAANVEYLVSVLPAHALSELGPTNPQFSLSSVLAAAGVADTVAARAGSVSYLVSIVAAVFVAGALTRKTQNAAFLVCVPPAFAGFGGTFIHVTQIATALPAALLLFAYLKGLWRTIVMTALLLLAVPWIWAVYLSLECAVAFPIAYLAWLGWDRNVRVTTLVAVAAGILDLGLIHAFIHAYGMSPVHAPAYVKTIDPNLAEASWSAFGHGNSPTYATAVLLSKLPTWGGLILLLATAISAALGTRVGPALLRDDHLGRA